MMTAKGKLFYVIFCKNCILENEDNDPVCEILIKILEGGQPPFKCEKYKRSGKNNE